MNQSGFIYGGDYNPEQWLAMPEILEQDIEYMKEAHINEVTLGVFSRPLAVPMLSVLFYTASALQLFRLQIML